MRFTFAFCVAIALHSSLAGQIVLDERQSRHLQILRGDSFEQRAARVVSSMAKWICRWNTST